MLQPPSPPTSPKRFHTASAVRESYLSLIVDTRSGGVPDDILRERRDALQGELAAIYAAAPQTNGKAYTAAQEALQKNQEYTFSDGELDKFLPEQMRKTGKKVPVKQ